MAPLVVGLCVEIYLISRIIVEQRWIAGLCAAAALGFFLLLWAVLPRSERAKQSRAN
jgi:hypothetical protein